MSKVSTRNASSNRWRRVTRSAKRRPAGVRLTPRYGTYVTSRRPRELFWNMLETEAGVTPRKAATGVVDATPRGPRAGRKIVRT
jgi:hypothetical protein